MVRKKQQFFFFIIYLFIYSIERRRIRFADPSSSSSLSSSLPTTASVTRWSDNIPNEEAEFGTPVAASQPPQYNAVNRIYLSITKIHMYVFFL